MRFDLKRPCANCPFANTEHRIRFACRERAAEIEELAYRNGFVCHKHAESFETTDGEEYFDFGENSQHCAGALLIYLKGGWNGNIPFEQLPGDERDRITERLDWTAPVFESEEDFLEANESPKG